MGSTVVVLKIEHYIYIYIYEFCDFIVLYSQKMQILFYYTHSKMQMVFHDVDSQKAKQREQTLLWFTEQENHI